jgi:hypothetical protein
MFYIGRSDKTPKALPDPLWLEQFSLLSGNLCVHQYILNLNGKFSAQPSSSQSESLKQSRSIGGSPMLRNVLVVIALVGCAVLFACGGGSMTTSQSSGSVPMIVTIGDTPPSSVALLFFEAMITGASLQPSDSSKSAVPIVTTPVEVEFGHLQTDTAFLNLANIPPDTYQSLKLTFSNATLTILNHSGAPIGSCANNSVCQLSPSFNPSSTIVSSSPFPITLSADSVASVKLDFNLNSSVQSDLSINPVVTVARLTTHHREDDNDEMERVDDLNGQITAVGTNQFTLTNGRSGQSFTITVDGNTGFEDFDRAGCTASPQTFACVMMGQIVQVDLSENGMGTMLAKQVELEAAPQQQAIKGTITSVDSGTQFHMVVFNEEPPVSGVSEGSPVVVTILPTATFFASSEEMGEDHGFMISGLSFASSADLLVGQDVQIKPQAVASVSGVTTITTDRIRLRPSQISGQIGTINGDGTFMLTGLSPLFRGATPPITSMNVNLVSEMEWEDVSGLGNLAPGNNVSVKGLLFKTTGAPTLLAKAVHKQ